MSFHRLTAAALAACTLLVCAPAMAQQEVDLGIELLPETREMPTYRVGNSVQFKDPAVAAAMSLVGPAAMGMAAWGVSRMPYPENIYVNGMRTSHFAGMVTAMASPLGLGFGQAYAGDPWRGFWVGVGGPATVLGAGMAGFAIDVFLNPSARWAGFGGLALGMAAGAVGYNVWAATDAFQTAERANRATWEAAGSPDN